MGVCAFHWVSGRRPFPRAPFSVRLPGGRREALAAFPCADDEVPDPRSAFSALVSSPAPFEMATSHSWNASDPRDRTRHTPRPQSAPWQGIRGIRGIRDLSSSVGWAHTGGAAAARRRPCGRISVRLSGTSAALGHREYRFPLCAVSRRISSLSSKGMDIPPLTRRDLSHRDSSGKPRPRSPPWFSDAKSQ